MNLFRSEEHVDRWLAGRPAGATLPVTTLGDVYTMVLYPAMSTHRTLTEQERTAAGIGDGLVRLSAGIEDVSDLMEDVDQALGCVPVSG